MGKSYLGWLVDIGELERPDTPIRVQYLLKDLFRVEFVPTHPLDQNRAENGILLRDRYMCEVPNSAISTVPIDMDCTILEMLIRLGIDAEDISHGFVDDPSVHRWIMEVLKNNGLYYKKYTFNDLKTPEYFSGKRMFPNENMGEKWPEIWFSMAKYLSQSMRLNGTE